MTCREGCPVLRLQGAGGQQVRLQSVRSDPTSPWASLRRVGSQGHGLEVLAKGVHLHFTVQGPAQERERGLRGLGVSVHFSVVCVHASMETCMWASACPLPIMASQLQSHCLYLWLQAGFSAGRVLHGPGASASISFSRAQCCASPVEGAGGTRQEEGAPGVPGWVGAG